MVRQTGTRWSGEWKVTTEGIRANGAMDVKTGGQQRSLARTLKSQTSWRHAAKYAGPKLR
jgi:hypothetical protein